jgi:hypothetical protein
MALNGISTLFLSSGIHGPIPAKSFHIDGSYTVIDLDYFNYDAYGYGFAIRKSGGGTIDNLMNQVIDLGSGSRSWTFVPTNGQPSFTRIMKQPDGAGFSLATGEGSIGLWVVNTDDGAPLSGTGAGQLNVSLIPTGTSFIIYATELASGYPADKQSRQVAKLNLSQKKRQGYTLSSTGTVVSGPDITKTFYRARNAYDITELPTQYSGGTVVDNPNVNGLVEGRPWVLGYSIAGLLLNVDAGNTASYSGGTTWTNLVGNGNNITLTGSPTYDAGIGSITFDGSTQYGTMTNPALLPTGNTISVIVWAFGLTAKGAHLINGLDISSNTSFGIYAPYTDNNIYWDAGFSSGVDRVNFSVGPTGYTGWHQWAFTKNASTGVMNIYKDGVSILTSTGKTRTIGISNSCLISAGFAGNTSTYKDGKISQIQISNLEITDAQVLANFTANRARYGI